MGHEQRAECFEGFRLVRPVAHGHAGAWERFTVSCDCGVGGCTQAMSWPTTQGVKWRAQLHKAGWTKAKKEWFAKGHAPPAKAEKAAA